MPLYLHPPSDCANMCVWLSRGVCPSVWWNTFVSWSMTVLHISSADLLYSLYLQLTYGVAAVGVFQPLFIHVSSLSIILLMAGMSLLFLRTASPLMMSASVWLSTMILMHCAFSTFGFHSSSMPSVDPASGSSGCRCPVRVCFGVV